ncbi:MAG: HNH endonuclease [Puniceicoccaceae bacterium]
MGKDRNFWLGKLANLNVARTEARGIAPHKPLMLLAVIDLIELGDVTEGWVKYDVHLVSRFRDYWELVLERQRNQPDILMPFHALGGERDRIWERFTEDGQYSLAKATTRSCQMDAGLFACFQDSEFCRTARETLVSMYFTASEQVMLCARLGLPVPTTSAVHAIRQDAAEFRARQKKGRDSRFKSEVLSGYYFTCALSGCRLDTEGSSLVQACHIHQHARSGNDDASNGLALTPDAHWMFDAGLWTVVCRGDEFMIQVAKDRFKESSPYGWCLGSFDERPLYFHDQARLRPDPKHLSWHQKRHGFRHRF